MKSIDKLQSVAKGLFLVGVATGLVYFYSIARLMSSEFLVTTETGSGLSSVEHVGTTLLLIVVTAAVVGIAAVVTWTLLLVSGLADRMQPSIGLWVSACGGVATVTGGLILLQVIVRYTTSGSAPFPADEYEVALLSSFLLSLLATMLLALAPKSKRV